MTRLRVPSSQHQPAKYLPATVPKHPVRDMERFHLPPSAGSAEYHGSVEVEGGLEVAAVELLRGPVVEDFPEPEAVESRNRIVERPGLLPVPDPMRPVEASWVAYVEGAHSLHRRSVEVGSGPLHMAAVGIRSPEHAVQIVEHAVVRL